MEEEVQTMENSTNKDDLTKNLTKCFERKINTEDFICEIEKRAALWDTRSEEYSNKNSKLRAWESVIVNFLPDFEAKPVNEKNILGEKKKILFMFSTHNVTTHNT